MGFPLDDLAKATLAGKTAPDRAACVRKALLGVDRNEDIPCRLSKPDRAGKRQLNRVYFRA